MPETGDAAPRPSPWCKGPIWAIPAFVVVSVVLAVPLTAVIGDDAVLGVVAAGILLWFWPIIVCFEKGRNWLGVLGIPFHIVSYWGAIRPARPDSYYARNFYGDDQMCTAIALYGEPGREATQGPPGWYPSDSDQGIEWYWDGKAWTKSRQVGPP